jgi:uncharacterized protein DUF5318
MVTVVAEAALTTYPRRMRTQRQVVDYALKRRALLRDLYAGRVGAYEVCDASPYLKSAAKYHGELTDERCPVCRRDYLTLVSYIYGDELRQSAGQARTRAELSVLAMTMGEFQVYVVEVCRGCGWNHLVEQYVLGRAGLTGDGLAQPLAVSAAAPAGATRTLSAAREAGPVPGGPAARRRKGRVRGGMAE